MRPRMKITGGAVCAACGKVRPFAQLLRVSGRQDPSIRHFVCSYSTDPGCFRKGTCSASCQSIGPAA